MLYKLSLVLSLTLVVTFSQETFAASDKVVCFFASWAGYRNGLGSFTPTKIDPNLCTHVLYAFLGVNSNGTLELLDPWNDIDLEGLANVAALKEKNPNLKVLISIGGWNAGNALLEGIVSSSKLRATLIESCISFFKKYNYDGIDIAWEYPQPADKNDFVKLLQEMRDAFDQEGYIISITVSADPRPSYDVPKLSKVVDLINVMTYDYHSVYDGQTGHNAPLYGEPSLNSSVSKWLESEVDPSKLTISIPTFGHSFTLNSVNVNNVGSPAGVGTWGPYTQNPGTIGYNEVCEFYSNYTRVWDEQAQVPYIYQDTDWMSYDDEESVKLKTLYAKDNGLAGVAVWSIDTDDFHSKCGVKNGILKTISENLF